MPPVPPLEKCPSNQLSPKNKLVRVVKTTYQIPPGPTLVPRILESRGPQPHLVPDRVQNLPSRVGHVNRLRTSVQPTRIKSVLRGRTCVLLERGQRTNVHRPFAEFYRLTLEKHPCPISHAATSASSPNEPTSSVYLMILSASDVYIVATNTRSRELDFSQNGTPDSQFTDRAEFVNICFQDTRSFIGPFRISCSVTHQNLVLIFWLDGA